MPTLAIAGGTSASLGRAITIALLASQNHQPWDVVILSRSSRAPLWLRAVDQRGTRTQIRVVDYLSQPSLAVALKGVDTLVSVTSAIDGTQPQIQINLLNAAVEAGCRRFAPSQWGFGPKGWENIMSTKYSFEGVWDACLQHKARIECAKFNQGSFMNYIGHGIYPSPSPSNPDVDETTTLQKLTAGHGYTAGEDATCQGLSRQGDLSDGSGAFLIGLANAIAELPVKDDGSWPRVTMTSLTDVGRFVVAALALPRWEEDMSMVGETLGMGELLAHAEAVTGKEFQVRTVTRASLEAQLQTIAPNDFMAQLWAEFKLAYTRDADEEVVLEPVLNRLCPAVTPMGVREYMETFWPREV